MKKTFTILIAALMLLTMINLPGKAVGQTTPTTLYYETFGNASAQTAVTSYTGWSAQSTMFNGTGTVASHYSGSGNVYKSSKVSSDYTNASGYSCVAFQGTKNTELTTDVIVISGIKVTGYTNLNLSFGIRLDNGNSTTNKTRIYYKIDNATSFSELSFTHPTSTGSWSELNGDISGTGESLTIKVELYTNGGMLTRYDDIKVTGVESTPTPTTYTVSFDCDGGTANCPDDITDLEEGDDFTIPSAAPTKDCYTFGGWFDDELNEYELGETYQCPASDLTLTADWTLNKYTVTYYSNNGETDEDVADDNLECGSAYTIADDPGFTPPTETPTFVNWNTQANGQGTTYTVGQQITISGNLNLYAQWTGATLYAVTFNCNGDNVEGCPANMNVEAGTQITLPDAPTREGYTFNCGGWWNTSDNSRYAPGSPYVVNAAVTFRADWIENQSAPAFTVTGVSNGTTDTYYATASVSINTVSGYTYFYTTNGDEPTTSSTEYTSAIVVNTTGSTTIKAIATQYGCTVSPIGTKTITIVQPNEATFTNGVYASLNTEANYNTWYKYNVSGNQVWSWASYNQTYYAKMSGYASNTNNANEDWLISPKMTVTNGKLAVSFDCAAKFGTNKLCSAQYSTDYPGYGDPSGYTWTKLIDLPYDNSYTFTAQNMTITGVTSDVYVAIKYVSTTSEASTIEINNFTAKQCYPITYYANGGTGTTADANSPYAVGTEVTILENAFTAPTGQEFTEWNTLANGTGTPKNPGQKITMTTDGYELYAKWGEACVDEATMNATTGVAAYNYNGGNKRFDINLSSSVKTLGGCDIYDYGFVYSTTATSPTVDGSDCTKVQVGDSQPTVDDAFEATLEDVTKNATYYVRSYATNNAGTAYSNPISVTVPAAFPTWNISYTTNGTADGSTTVEQGDKISGLKAAPTAANVPSGYTFMGWYNGDYPLNNTAPTFVKNGDAISGDLALKAVFAIAGANNSTTGELTQSEITSNITSSACAYGTEKTYEDTGDGINWIASCFADQGRLWMQIKKDASDSYIKIVAPDVITNVEVLMTSTSNSSGGIADITKHTAFSGTVYLATSAGTSSTGNVGSMSSSNFDGNYANINPTGNNSTLYIQVTGGAARIWGISVTYGGVEYSSYCTTVSPQTAISGTISEGHLTTDGTIAANTAVSITGLTINSGVTLTVNGVISTANPSDLIIEDGGRLIVYNEGVQATVKKEVEGVGDENWSATSGAKGWYFIASPVNGASFSTAAIGGYDLYMLDWANEQWLNQKNDEHSALFANGFQRGTGYLYANKEDLHDDDQLSFAGEIQPLNNEDKATVTLAVDGWNLIGNPLTCKVTVDKAFSELNDDGSGLINQNEGSAINPCQGIAVYGDADDVVTFTKAESQNAAAPSNSASLQMTLAKNVSTRGTVSSKVVDNAIVNFDGNSSLPKFTMIEGDAKLFIPQNGEDYAIAFSNRQGDMPLNFKAKELGTYTISFAGEEMDLNGIYLIDILEQKEIDLSVNPSYTFIGSPADRSARFKIVFRNVNGSNDSDIFAYQSDNDIVVTGEGELQIFDVMGRMIKTQHVSGVQTVDVNAQGVYIMKLNEKTQKIVIR